MKLEFGQPSAYNMRRKNSQPINVRARTMFTHNTAQLFDEIIPIALVVHARDKNKSMYMSELTTNHKERRP